MSTRPALSDDRRTPEVNGQLASFYADTVAEVARAVERDPLVVVGMAQNPFVKKVRAALTAAGLPFTYLEYGSYLSEWRRRLAVKLWSGYPTFPQVFVRGVLIGGFNETKKAIDDGSLRRRLETGTSAAGSTSPSTSSAATGAAV